MAAAVAWGHMNPHGPIWTHMSPYGLIRWARRPILAPINLLSEFRRVPILQDGIMQVLSEDEGSVGRLCWKQMVVAIALRYVTSEGNLLCVKGQLV